MSPVRDPTPRPDPFLIAGRNIDRAGRIYRQPILGVLDDRIGILEDGTVQVFVVVGVLGDGTPSRGFRCPVLRVDLLQVLDIIGIKKIEAKAEPDHRPQDRDRLVPILPPLPPLGPPISLLRSIFPEIDPMAQPIVSVPTELKCPPPIYDVQRDGESSTVITDDRAVVVVESHHRGKTGVGSRGAHPTPVHGERCSPSPIRHRPYGGRKLDPRKPLRVTIGTLSRRDRLRARRPIEPGSYEQTRAIHSPTPGGSTRHGWGTAGTEGRPRPFLHRAITRREDEPCGPRGRR